MRAAPVLACALAAVAVGCGNERATPPDLAAVAQPGGYITYTTPDGDVSFRHPRAWPLTPGPPPQVAQIASGSALAAVYVYPRDDLPADEESLDDARRRLIASLRERDPSFEVQRTELTEVDGAPAVVIQGAGRVGERIVATRSVHVYEGAAEYVVDAYAAPRVFAAADRSAFAPLVESLQVGGEPRLED